MREVVESLRNRIVLRADKRNRVPLLYALVFLLFFAWLFFDDMIGTITFPASEKVIEANVRMLKEMEEKAPPDISGVKRVSAAAESAGEMTDSTEGEKKFDVTGQMKIKKEEREQREQKKIMTMNNPDIAVFNQWFDGCAVLGDSLAESAGEYGFLNQSILFAEIGCSVTGAGNLVDSMKKMYPGKIFLAFGSNDMENYGTNVERFIEHYREMISDIQAELPDAQIYVSAVLPMQQKAIDREPKRKNVELYNEKLKNLCETMKLTFLDPGFILEQDASLYEPDGIHAVKKFYYKWLTYLADMAGVSG